MRRVAIAVGAGVLASTPAAAWAVDPPDYSPMCKPWHGQPCTPMVCTPSGGPRCAPHIMQHYAQELRMIIKSRNLTAGRVPERPVNTLRELYTALRRCWEPPAREEAHRGMQMSVRFAFNRSGEIISAPRVTYSSKNVDADTQQRYHDSIAAALERCTPMPLTKGFGSALAGRPVGIRFIDDRTN
jgi:hypothetical protein